MGCIRVLVKPVRGSIEQQCIKLQMELQQCGFPSVVKGIRYIKDDRLIKELGIRYTNYLQVTLKKNIKKDLIILTNLMTRVCISTQRECAGELSDKTGVQYLVMSAEGKGRKRKNG